MAPPESESSLDDALAAIWQRAQPKLLARLDVIDTAVAAMGRGDLDPELAESARSEAHKTAGLIGTFGLHDGTDLARTLEHGLEPDAGADPAEMTRTAGELRAMLESAG
jgi:Hpt domain